MNSEINLIAESESSVKAGATPISIFVSVYKKILLHIIYYGMYLFIGGIYIFPNNSGTQQVFYLLITLPFLLLFPLLIKELPWKSKCFYVYMAFPLYMFVSHYWAPYDSVERGWFFFFRQLICFFIFYMALWLIIRLNNKFVEQIIVFLIVIGALSASISLSIHIYSNTDFYNTPLFGFSIVDIDKASAIYAIHLGFCIAAMATIFKTKESVLLRLLLFVAILLDLFAISLTKAIGGWVIVFISLTAVLLDKIKNRRKSFIAAVLIAFLFGLVGFVLFTTLLSERTIDVRVHLISLAIDQWVDNFYFGVGLTYKLPIENDFYSQPLPHSHNFIIDTLRFGGLIGGLLLLINLSVGVLKNWFPSSCSRVNLYLVVWLVCGIVASSIYGQQPYVRPGSYMWFFYWMPLALTLVCYLNSSEDSRKLFSASSDIAKK